MQVACLILLTALTQPTIWKSQRWMCQSCITYLISHAKATVTNMTANTKSKSISVVLNDSSITGGLFIIKLPRNLIDPNSTTTDYRLLTISKWECGLEQAGPRIQRYHISIACWNQAIRLRYNMWAWLQDIGYSFWCRRYPYCNPTNCYDTWICLV